MLFTPEALLIFSLHILSINSASSAVAAGFDLNLDDALSADSTNMFLDDKVNSDYFMTSAGSTNLLGSERVTLDSGSDWN